MDPSDIPDPIFIVDLNELEDDGFHIPVAMDFTLNLGPLVRNSMLRRPELGEWVRIHSDEDDTLFYARVDEQLNERDYLVAIDWTTCSPVLNSSWSGRVRSLELNTGALTQPAEVES